MQIQISSTPVYTGQITQVAIGNAVALVVGLGTVTLGQGVVFPYTLLDADGNQIGVAGTCALTAAQYADWTTDDLYVAQCIATNLGLTPS